jgi:hypothetical protein
MAKTLSSYSNTVRQADSTFFQIPYGTAYSAGDTIIGGAAAAKVTFDTIGASDYLTASSPNNNFTSVDFSFVWRVDYSGWLQFAAGDQTLTLAVYLNGVAVPQLTQVIKSSDGEYLPFAKSWIMEVPLGQTVDLRATASPSNASLVNTTFLLQQVSYNI